MMLDGPVSFNLVSDGVRFFFRDMSVCVKMKDTEDDESYIII